MSSISPLPFLSVILQTGHTKHDLSHISLHLVEFCTPRGQRIAPASESLRIARSTLPGCGDRPMKLAACLQKRLSLEPRHGPQARLVGILLSPDNLHIPGSSDSAIA
jgi:hypothetical protein